jgi:hypothetical protein
MLLTIEGRRGTPWRLMICLTSLEHTGLGIRANGPVTCQAAAVGVGSVLERRVGDRCWVVTVDPLSLKSVYVSE